MVQNETLRFIFPGRELPVRRGLNCRRRSETHTGKSIGQDGLGIYRSTQRPRGNQIPKAISMQDLETIAINVPLDLALEVKLLPDDVPIRQRFSIGEVRVWISDIHRAKKP